MTDGGPVRAVEPLGATRTRFPAGSGVEAPLAAANRSARALSLSVLDELLPGYDAGAVAAAGGQEQCHLVEPGLAVLDGLLTPADLDRLVQESLHPMDGDAHRGWHPRVFRGGQRQPAVHHVAQDAFLAEGRGGRIDPYRLAAAFREGGSLYLRDAAAHHLPLRRLIEHFRRVFGGGGEVGLFLSRGVAEAPLGLHWDETENVCFQLVGRRRWEVRRPSIPDNHYALLREDGEPGEVAWAGVLEPGQALTFPRAWWHEVTPVDPGLSVSITVGVNRPIAHDALHWLLPQGALVDGLRRPLAHPEAGPADALGPVRDLVAGVSDEAFLAHLQARELPLAAGAVGLAEILDLARPEDLVVRTQLPGAVTVVDDGGTGLAVAAAGRVVSFDPAYSPVVGALLAGPPVRVGDLFGRAGTPEGVVLVADQLVRNDWCVPARPGEDPLARHRA